MTGAARGIYFERRVAEILATRGWFTIRAAGSHGIADVVAVAPGVVVFVQCKTGGVIRGPEWNRLYDVATAMGALPVLAQYTSDTHRGVTFLEITGTHKANSHQWPSQAWLPVTVSPVRQLDPDTMAKVQELELERLNRTSERW